MSETRTRVIYNSCSYYTADERRMKCLEKAKNGVWNSDINQNPQERQSESIAWNVVTACIMRWSCVVLLTVHYTNFVWVSQSKVNADSRQRKLKSIASLASKLIPMW